MKFDKLFTLLTEKNIYYKAPNDGIKLIYDFYYLTGLYGFLKSKTGKHGDSKWFGFRDESLEHSFRESVNIIVQTLETLFLKELADNAIDEFSNMVEEIPQSILDKYPKLNKQRLDDLNLPTSTKMQIINQSFSSNDHYFKASWIRNWHKIVKAWYRLQNAKTTDDKIIAIDHIFDLEHGNYANTTGAEALLLNRINLFPNANKTKAALDHKSSVKSLSDLKSYVSPLAKSIGERVAKVLK